MIRRTLVSLVLFGSLLFAQSHTASGNIPRDLLGTPDTRMAGQQCYSGPCIWGNAQADVSAIHFNPPAGYRVRILRLRGDLVAWIKSLPGDPVTPLESTSGVLMGFSTSAPGGSAYCDLCADNTALYIQDSVTATKPSSRAPYEYDNVDQVLESDNVLNLVIAAWLNTTGKPIHIEATYTITFVYEPIPQ